MMDNETIRIPDDVWENRCMWCMHRQAEQNRTMEKWQLLSGRPIWDGSKPCRIMSLRGYDQIPGECEHFAPNEIYGICDTCENCNIFCEPTYCLAAEQPNKRQLFMGEGYGNPAFWAVHRLSTCDNYEPNHLSMGIMRKQAAEGKIPRNFDPDTMEPVTEAKANETAEKWAAIALAREQELAEKRRQEEAEREKLTAESSGQCVGQISMAELIAGGEQ